MSTYTSASGDLGWKVSSFCDGGQCVRVARRGDFILVGNTNSPETVSEFTADEWKQFLAGAKLGEFDSFT
jgi:hypothetical protein